MKVMVSLLCLLAWCFFWSATDASAQENETNAKIRQRVENFFKTIREEKWDEVAAFVIVSTDKYSPQTRQRMNITDDDTPDEINKKVGVWFKRLYGVKKPGKIISIGVLPNDPTLAGIGYKHGDKDGFVMRFYKGEWYYTHDRNPETVNQNNSDDTIKIRERAELMLQTIREYKWDELYKFVDISTKQRAARTRQRMGISETDDENEIRVKVAAWFKRLYLPIQPGKVARVNFYEKDKTVARITYRHEDLDGFFMVLIGDEWYYTLGY